MTKNKNLDNNITEEEKNNMLDEIISESNKNPDISRNDFQKLKNAIYKEYKINKPIASIEILNHYYKKIKNWELEENSKLIKLFRKRWVRSLSWVTVISLLTKPFWCPWECIFCPSYPDLPKSYIPNEPAVARAELNKFDPVKQIHNRLRALEVTGHKIDKNDVRIIGWTWNFYDEEYREEFMKWIYDAFNTYWEMKNHIEETNFWSEKFADFKLKDWYKLSLSKSLDEAKKTNESATARVIWVAVETRPDFINPDELKCFNRHWVTRVEIWYQTTFDEINKLNKRWHWNKESIEATKLLKDAWFKVVAHMMPNLYWSNIEMDKQSMKEMRDNPGFRPDELKIYPCVVTPYSELEELYKQWKHKPYTDEELINLTADLQEIVPEYIRLNRTYRDIPANHILWWSTISNLRQIVDKKMAERWQIALDVRAREIKDKTNDPTKAVLHEIDYEASKWKEHFLTFEDPEDRTIFSLLRLRIPSQHFTKEKHFIEELEWCAIIRELHTFGDQLWIWEKWSTFGQHIWFWKRLVTRAEEIAKSYWIKKMAVISWVWVRAYYEKRWYKLKWEYMIKTLD